MNNKIISIYKAIDDAIQRIIENHEINDDCTINIENVEVEGNKEGVGLIVGEINGYIEITNYYNDNGDYWTPSYCNYDTYINCDLSYIDEYEKEHIEKIEY